MNKSIRCEAMSLAVIGLLLVAGVMAGAPVLAQSQLTSPRVTVERDQVVIASQSVTQRFRVEIFSPGGEPVFDSGFVIGQPVSWNMKDQQDQTVADGVYVVLLSTTNAKGKVRKMIEQVIVWHKAAESTKSQSAMQQTNIADAPQPGAIQDSSAGTPGKIAKWTAADALGDSVITEDTSKIGIASLTPTATLHVDAAQPRISLADGTNAVTLLQTSGGKGGDANGATTGGKGADISLLAGNGGDAPAGTSGNGGNVTIQAGSPGSGAMTGESGRVLIAPFVGKVGIGTVNPDEKLTVEGNIQISGGSNGLKFADSTLQTTAGLTGVTHNMTLSGDGTGGLPLTVADQGIDTVQLKDGGVFSSKIAAGQIVRSLNSLKDDVTLAAGDNITITPGGSTLTIAATGGTGAVNHNATLAGDGTNANPLGVSAPLSLNGSDAGSILSVANGGSGPAITATGAINTTTQYNIAGARVLSIAGTNNIFAGAGAGANNSGVGNTFVGSAAGQANNIGNLNSFIGQTAGLNNTSGSQNTFVGNSAGFQNTTGNQNSFFGTGAGALNTSGGGNSSFGFFAGRKNTTGSVNSFFGFEAGRENTTGTNNSFFGSYAGQLNTTGASNSFFGSLAGQSTTTGTSNSFFGRNAGSNNTSGDSNSFFGHQAGSSNIGGSGNSFFGRNAGASNTSSNNSFFGIEAGLSNTNGFDNSFFGREAGRNNTTGQNNSFFGSQAGHDNTGDQNSFFGRSAGTNNASASNNSFFGFNAGRDNTSGQSNAFFGASAGRDNTTGGENAFFGRGAGLSNTSGIQNAFVGRGAGSSNTTGDHNSFFGWAAGAANTTGNHNTFIGALADGEPALNNATAIGYKAMVTQNNSIVLGSINGVNGAGVTAKVGIGTTAPAERLHVQGNVRISNPAAGPAPALILDTGATGSILFRSTNPNNCFILFIGADGTVFTSAHPCP